MLQQGSSVGLKKHEHMQPVLKNLHWLPVKSRIDYKILLISYKALNCFAPIYIQEFFQPACHNKSLWSVTRNDLQVPQSNSSYGDRCFRVIAPKLWNNLPRSFKSIATIDCFKKALKTHLFSVAYN